MKGELITPRIGPLSVLAATAVLVLQLLLGLWVVLYFGSWIGQAIWIGLMWLGCSMTASVCFTAMVSWRRVLLGVASYLWHAMFMAVCWRESPLRYLLLFGALMVLQSAASTALGVPAWQSWRAGHGQSTPRYRFTIRSILVSTTMIAVLMAAGRAYALPAMEMPLAAVPLFTMLFIGSASSMLAPSFLKARAACLVTVLLGGSLLYFIGTFSLQSSFANRLTLRQVIQSMLVNGADTFELQVQLLTFGSYTLGACLWFALGRIDQRDFQLRQRRIDRMNPGSAAR